VPTTQRGVYFSSEAAVTNVLNVLLLGGIAVMLLGSPGIGRYLSIYAIGIASGLFSLAWMFRVPGGHAVPIASDPSCHDTLRRALADKTFLRFVAIASLCFSSFAWMNAVSTLYMRDVLGLEWQVMAIQAAVSLAILMTIRAWARYADHSGSGRAMALTLVGHAVTTAAFLFLRPGSVLTYVALVPVVIAWGVFNTAFWMAVNRAMLNRLQDSCRVGYSNVWTVGTNVAMGATPIIAGSAVQHMGMWGYRLCFGIAIVSALLCAIASLRIVTDGRTLPPSLSVLINPALPLRTLARLTWISLGLHESNRSNA
jgi:predicted MFS family arabinose efflux permease